MRNIGIDVSKKKIDVFIPPETYLAFSNVEQGFQELLEHLMLDDVLGVESTGTYHHSLAAFFLKHGFEVREINPILTKQFTRATVRKKKTDKSDSKIISLLLTQGEGYPMRQESINNLLQKLTRTRRKLIKMRTSVKLQIQALSKEKEFTLVSESLQSLVNEYNTQIDVLEKSILEYQSEETQILESIPGISPNLCREILTELGDISRFKAKKQVVAYAGYDPKIRQSGTSVNSTGKLTKRGSSYLRNALFLASFANVRSKNFFSIYYKKKKGEGKHHFQAMTATSRKMLEIIFSLLNKRQKFSLDFS